MQNLRFRKNNRFIVDAVNALRQYGVVIIDDFYSKFDTDTISKELSSAYDLASFAGTKRSVGNGEYGLCPRDLVESRKNDIPYFYKFLQDTALHEIGGMFFDLNRREYPMINNHVEFELNSKKGSSNAGIPHFDRVPALKMCVYLSDVDKSNGPTFVYPRTYQKIRKHLYKTLSSTNDMHDLKNFIRPDELELERVFVECKKGTLIIVDTSSLHGGGNMKINGAVRKVIRAVTWYLPSSYQNLSQSAIAVKDAVFISGDLEQETQSGLNLNAFKSFSELNSSAP